MVGEMGGGRVAIGVPLCYRGRNGKGAGDVPAPMSEIVQRGERFLD